MAQAQCTMESKTNEFVKNHELQPLKVISREGKRVCFPGRFRGTRQPPLATFAAGLSPDSRPDGPGGRVH